MTHNIEEEQKMLENLRNKNIFLGKANQKYKMKNNKMKEEQKQNKMQIL